MNELKFSDSVWHRVVQIVQEAMLTGVDCADLLRQIRVVSDPDDQSTLVLSAGYRLQVTSMHEKMLQQARELQASQTGNRFIVPGGSSERD
jgi:hypothetical protein